MLERVKSEIITYCIPIRYDIASDFVLFSKYNVVKSAGVRNKEEPHAWL